jgi:hypothetical protein
MPCAAPTRVTSLTLYRTYCTAIQAGFHRAAQVSISTGHVDVPPDDSQGLGERLDNERDTHSIPDTYYPERPILHENWPVNVQ